MTTQCRLKDLLDRVRNTFFYAKECSSLDICTIYINCTEIRLDAGPSRRAGTPRHTPPFRGGPGRTRTVLYHSRTSGKRDPDPITLYRRQVGSVMRGRHGVEADQPSIRLVHDFNVIRHLGGYCFTNVPNHLEK